MSDPIDVGDALDSVVTAFQAKFTDFATVAAEDQSRTELAVPAIIIQLTDFEPMLDRDPHTGQFPCHVRLEARIVLGHRTAKVRREVARAAASVAAFVHSNRFGERWGAAQILAVEPDEFAPQAEQFDIWRVEWAHRADLGESYFLDGGTIPTQILTSWAPEIGPPNEDQYVPEVTDV